MVIMAHSSERMSPNRVWSRAAHVELGRILDEPYGGVVDVHVVQGHVRVGLGDLGHHLAPQDGGGEHVGLVDGVTLDLRTRPIQPLSWRCARSRSGGTPRCRRPSRWPSPSRPLAGRNRMPPVSLAHAGDVQTAIGRCRHAVGRTAPDRCRCGGALQNSLKWARRGSRAPRSGRSLGGRCSTRATHRSEQHRIGRFAAFDRAWGKVVCRGCRWRCRRRRDGHSRGEKPNLVCTFSSTC